MTPTQAAALEAARDQHHDCGYTNCPASLAWRDTQAARNNLAEVAARLAMERDSILMWMGLDSQDGKYADFQPESPIAGIGVVRDGKDKPRL